MKTEIFENYSAFLKREDKSVNGVDQAFADNNPNYEKENETNRGCYRCSDCSDCSGCSDCSDCSDCSGCYRCSDCSGCSGCSDCSGCSGCYRCSDCSGCSGCYRCSDCSFKTDIKDNDKSGTLLIPIIPNIHQKVLEAATSTDSALNMESWHTCETTHCRAGWVEVLGGKEGKELAAKTSTLYAAMMIYKKSSPNIRVFPPRFFESNEVALDDMKRCAELERLT